jgi:hypothetical protein
VVMRFGPAVSVERQEVPAGLFVDLEQGGVE